jgi:hypothetical protein
VYAGIETHFQKVHDSGSSAVKRVKLPQLFAERKHKLWHACFSAAYLLDPIYFIKDARGAWWPPLTKLTAEQRAEAKECIISITPPAHQTDVAIEWSTMLLDGLTAGIDDEVMQLLTARKQQANGKVSVASVSRRQKWWCNHGSTSFPNIAAAALRLLAMPVTTGAAERNWSIWGQVYTKLRNRLGIQRGEMIVFIRQNLKLQDSSLPDDEDIAMQLALEDAEDE